MIMTSVLLQNVIVALIVTGITFAVLFLLKFLNKKNAITSEVSRKVVHIGAGTLYLALYFYNDRGSYSKYFNIFPNVFWTCVLIWMNQPKSSTSSGQLDDLLVGTMTRHHHPGELLRGPLFFNFVAILCGTVFYKTVLGSVTMAILTWGDGLAAVIGAQYGTQRKLYHSKTWDGFLTMIVAGFLASCIYVAILVNFQSIQLWKFFIVSIVAGVTEALTPSDFDNLTIPLCIIFTYVFIF